MDECLRKIFNKKEQEAVDKIFQEYDKNTKKMLKEEEAELRKTPNKEMKKFLKESIRRFKMKLQTKTLKKRIKERKERLRKTFCNPGCKDTIFEPGNPDQLTKSFIKLLNEENERNRAWKDPSWSKPGRYLVERKELFGDKTNVLENNFYKGLKKKTIKRLKSRGAVSGCQKQNDDYPLLQT